MIFLAAQWVGRTELAPPLMHVTSPGFTTTTGTSGQTCTSNSLYDTIFLGLPAVSVDNTNALNAALAALNTAGGGVLTIAPGTYTLTAEYTPLGPVCIQVSGGREVTVWRLTRTCLFREGDMNSEACEAAWSPHHHHQVIVIIIIIRPPVRWSDTLLWIQQGTPGSNPPSLTAADGFRHFVKTESVFKLINLQLIGLGGTQTTQGGVDLSSTAQAAFDLINFGFNRLPVNGAGIRLAGSAILNIGEYVGRLYFPRMMPPDVSTDEGSTLS